MSITGGEQVVCDGWSEEQIRQQCEQGGFVDHGNCAVQDIGAPFNFAMGGACPVKPLTTPIRIVENAAAEVTIEAAQLFVVTRELSWIAVDCIDPSADQDGDPAGGTPPTCDNCCPKQEDVAPGLVPDSRRKCKCKDGWAVVAVYIQDNEVGPDYPPLTPPIPQHCQPSTQSTACRFVYRVPCGCESESYDLGQNPRVDLLEPETIITMQPDGTQRIQQSLDREFTPTDPQAGPATYTHLFTDITIDPTKHAIVELSQHVGVDVVGCVGDFLAFFVELHHELVELLNPENYDAPELVVTAPATWICEGSAIFRKVLARRWNDEDSFLMVATEAIQFDKVIKEGTIRLETNDLKRDFIAEAAAAQAASPAPSAQGLHVQHTGRKLQGFLNDAFNWVDRNVVRPAYNTVVKPVVDTVKKGAEFLWNGVKLVFTGSASVNDRWQLLDATIEKEVGFSQGPLSVDITATGHLGLAVNVIFDISGYSLKHAELSIEGDAEIECVASVGATAAYEYTKEWEILKLTFRHISFAIGPIPVVIKPSLPVTAGFELALEGTINFAVSVKAGAHAKYGFRYTSSSGWNQINEYNPYFEHEKSINVQASLEALLYVRPAVAIEINLVLDFNVGLKIGPLLTATASLCKNENNVISGLFSIDIDLQELVDLHIRIGFDIEILSLLKEWEIDLFTWTQDLYDFTYGPLQLAGTPPPLLAACGADGTAPDAPAIMPASTVSSRRFGRTAQGKRCSNYDYQRDWTSQDSAENCFKRCEEVRGCGKCPKFAWSSSENACMFSKSTHTSCDEENWNGWDIYESRGPCQPECPDGSTFMKVDVGASPGYSYSSNSKTVSAPEVASCFTPCGRGCRLNPDFADAGDEFELSVDTSRSEVTARRSDSYAGWGMNLQVPCCKASNADCQGQWASWSPCSKTCGTGTRTRSFTVLTAAQGAGKACPQPETQECSSSPCGCPTVPSMSNANFPSSCQNKGSYYWCTGSCQTGHQGTPKAQCRPDGSWAYSGECKPVCGAPQAVPNANFPSSCAGTEPWGKCYGTCQAGSSSVWGTPRQTCMPSGSWRVYGACMPDRNCVSAWSSWGECSHSCGGGTRSRTISITTAASGKGTPCPASPETEACNTQPCSCCDIVTLAGISQQSSRMGEFVKITSLSKNSRPMYKNSNNQYLYYWISKNGNGIITYQGWRISADHTQVYAGVASTGRTVCPADVGEWWAWYNSKWNKRSDATAVCTNQCTLPTGYTSSVTACLAAGGCSVGMLNGGSITCAAGYSGTVAGSAACTTDGQAFTGLRDCVEDVNCVSSWSPWSTCSYTCSGGTRSRTLTITTPPSGNGQACPTGPTSEACNTQPCSCCSSITIDGASDVQSNRMGVFDVVPNLIRNDRVVYQNSKNEYLFYSKSGSFQAWLIGSDYNTGSGGILSQNERTGCPVNATSPWKAYYNNKWNDRPSITATCGVTSCTLPTGYTSSVAACRSGGCTLEMLNGGSTICATGLGGTPSGTATCPIDGAAFAGLSGCTVNCDHVSTTGFLATSAPGTVLPDAPATSPSDIVFHDSGSFMDGTWISSSSRSFRVDSSTWIIAMADASYIKMVEVKVSVDNGLARAYVNAAKYFRASGKFTASLTSSEVMAAWSSSSATGAYRAASAAHAGYGIAGLAYCATSTCPTFTKIADQKHCSGSVLAGSGGGKSTIESCFKSCVNTPSCAYFAYYSATGFCNKFSSCSTQQTSADQSGTLNRLDGCPGFEGFPGCDAGFDYHSGDVAGFGSINGKGGGQDVASCEECATLCKSEATCGSYECSPSKLKCNLNEAWVPSQPAQQDYLFCSRSLYHIKTQKTQRWLSAKASETVVGTAAHPRGTDTLAGTQVPAHYAVLADADYSGRALFHFIPHPNPDSGTYLIQNAMTGRYLLDPFPGTVNPGQAEAKGWNYNHPMLLADDNYEGRAVWKLRGGQVIENEVTKRWLFGEGATVQNPGTEGLSSLDTAKETTGADANYYGLTIWQWSKV